MCEKKKEACEIIAESTELKDAMRLSQGEIYKGSPRRQVFKPKCLSLRTSTPAKLHQKCIHYKH